MHVISHKGCFDGQTAAWVHWRFCDHHIATYHYCNYHDRSAPQIEDWEGVWMTDFFRLDWFEDFYNRGCSIRVLDHHESAMVDVMQWLGRHLPTLAEPEAPCVFAPKFSLLSFNDWLKFAEMTTDEVEDWIDANQFQGFIYNEERMSIYFDLSRCGALIAWEHFAKFQSTPALPLVKYVDDRDRWQWRLPHSEEVSEGLGLTFNQHRTFWAESQLFMGFGDALSPQSEAKRQIIREFELIEQLAFSANYVDLMVEKGRSQVEIRREIVAEMVKAVTWKEIGGYNVPTCHAPKHHSWAAHELLKKYPEASFAAVRREKDGVQVWDLRSRPGFRVNRVARQYGGGGHPTAAGFSV